MEEKIGKLLREKGLRIATTESCTGGLLSSKLTDVSGSSEYIHLNLVTYSNEAKHKMLGVKTETLENYGAVSSECSFEMACGLYQLTNADICVSTTGIAGPTGGTKEKPVGLVYISIKYNGIITIKEVKLPPNTPRIQMKEEFAKQALKFAISILSGNKLC